MAKYTSTVKNPKGFIAISEHVGSIGELMAEENFIEKLIQEQAIKGHRRTPLQMVDTYLDEDKLSYWVQEKFSEYRRNVAHMDLPGAIRYTANFYKKGLRTFIPIGCL